MDKARTALVLGATGGIGSEIAHQLRDQGWAVRTLRRSQPDAVMDHDGITSFRGDAMRAEDVAVAARGCGVIVHAVNPPGYRRWSELVLPMADNTITAAIANAATIVLPGSLYNFGPDAFPVLREDAPQRPVTRKGVIRVELERRLEHATHRGARVIIVRAGDFFGPSSSNNWFGLGLVKPGIPVRSISQPGVRGIGHQWAYLPDVARTMCELLARREALPAFARFHLAGHWDCDGTQMAQTIQNVVARCTGASPVLRRFPWWLVLLGAPFDTTMRELLEMRYLWREPLRLDNAGLRSVLGSEPHTPLAQAVEATLVGLRCVSPAPARVLAI